MLKIPPRFRIIIPVPVVVQAGFGVVVLAGEAQVEGQFDAIAVGVFVEFDRPAERREAVRPDHLPAHVADRHRRAQVVARKVIRWLSSLHRIDYTLFK